MSEGSGKGDTPRSVNKKKYDATLDRVFGEKDIMEYHKDAPHKKGYRDLDEGLPSDEHWN